MSLPTVFKPPFEYAVLFNGQDVTDLQLERFTQKRELNLLKRYDFVYDNFGIKIPFDYNTSFTTGLNNNIVQVNKNGEPIFIGYAADKVINNKTKYYEIDSKPFLNLLSKSQTVHSETIYTNIINEMINIFNTALAKISNYYTLSSEVSSLNGLFPISLYVSSTSAINDINLVLQLCELADIGIYFIGTDIYFFPVAEVWPNSDNSIEDYVISPENFQQATELYYDKISITYKNSPAGADKTVTAGSGNIVKSINYSNFYLDDTSAQAIADRKLNIYMKDYVTIDNLEINKQFEMYIGKAFSYLGYNFICTAIEENQTTYKINGIGVLQ